MSNIDGNDPSQAHGHQVNGDGADAGGAGAPRRAIGEAVAARQRALMVSGLRGFAKPGSWRATDAHGSGSPTRAEGPGAATVVAAGASAPTPSQELCDLCGTTIPHDHRHLLHLVERRIVCSCEPCWGMRSGESDYRPVGNRTVWLDDMVLPDDVWANFQIPIGLAFFMGSTVTSCVVAMYPSPGGATESELHFESWAQMVAINPVIAGLEPDVEGLIVNRLTDPPIHVIAPIDRCYELTGLIKANWQGISGGDGLAQAVAEFFEHLRGDALKVQAAAA